MTVDSVIAHFRRREEGLFSEEVRVTRSTGEGVLDTETGKVTDPEPEEIYEGPGQVRSWPWQGTDVTVGEGEVRIRRAQAKLPHDTEVRKDDIVEVLESRHDAGLVGRSYRVTDVLHDGWQITRKVIAEDVTVEDEAEESS